MTRAHLLALLRIDAGENPIEIPESTWLMQMGYIDDDGCEVFITELGDTLINRACSTHNYQPQQSLLYPQLSTSTGANMFIAGYIYTSNPSKPGIKHEVFKTKAEAEGHIREKLAGKQVEFLEGEEGKFRAYADGQGTAYIYFEVKKEETWALFDRHLLGEKGMKAVVATGSLAAIKDKARAVIAKDLKARSRTLKKCDFVKTRDNMMVEFVDSTDPYAKDSGLVLIRV